MGYPLKVGRFGKTGRPVGSGALKRPQRVEDRLRLEALPVIDFDVGESDTAVPGDHVCRRHRQFPALIAVDLRQCLVVGAQGSTQFFRQRIDQTETAGRVIATSLKTSKVNSFACKVERDWSGSCGEIATSWAAKAAISRRTAW